MRSTPTIWIILDYHTEALFSIWAEKKVMRSF